MSDDEYSLYQDICSSYDSAGYKGSDLFLDLFESDDNGVILFLKPPRKRSTTMEVFLFLSGLMTQQHLRINYMQIEDLTNQIKNKLNDFEQRLSKLEKKD